MHPTERYADLVGQIEVHSVEGIRRCFERGIDPNELYNDEPLIYELTSEYTRGTRFKECAKVFVDHGLKMEDKALLAVLLDDAPALTELAGKDKGLVSKKYNLRCAYTPLYQATLLHICAEFNHPACAEVLVNYGADINVEAGKDEYGFGGHTPIFHTVNQNNNRSEEMLHFLLDHRANLQLMVTGLVWGKGYPWETLIPAVTPVSYAMMGLIPQMHRKEETVSKTVKLLMKHAFGTTYHFPNVPNQYLKS